MKIRLKQHRVLSYAQTYIETQTASVDETAKHTTKKENDLNDPKEDLAASKKFFGQEIAVHTVEKENDLNDTEEVLRQVNSSWPMMG